MTSKERARLRGLANGIETVLQIGKDGIGENLIRQADVTLEARELIKVRVLDGCMDYTPRTAADALASATGGEVVQVIGSKFVLYRKKKDAEAEKKASKPRKKPSPAPRDISPKGGDTGRKVGQNGGKPFRARSGTQTGNRDAKRFSPARPGTDAGRRDVKRFSAPSRTESGNRDVKRSPARPGTKTGDRNARRFSAPVGTKTGDRNKRRSPAPLGRGTGARVKNRRK